MMVARKMEMMRRLPAAKVVLVACGIAGCTSGPVVQTADRETTVQTVAAVEFVETVEIPVAEQADKPSLRERWRETFQFKKPVWLERLVKQEEQPAPVDPFVVAHIEKQARNAEPLVDYTPVVIHPVAHRESQPIWSRDAIRLDGLTPKWFSNGTASDATPVDVEHDPGNPFVDAGIIPVLDQAPASETNATVLPTSWNHPSSAGQPTGTPRSTPSAAASTEQKRTISIQSYLSRDHGIPGGVVHRDMIIDSSLVQPQFDRRVRPISAEQPIEPNTTLPRRPFGESTWEEPESQPTASANQPVSVTPELPRPAEQVSFSSGRGRTVRTPLFSGSEYFREVETNENPFAAVEGLSNELKISSVNRSPVIASRPAVAKSLGTNVVAAESETDLPLPNALDLSDARRLAQKEAQSSAMPRLGTPAAVGLGLAAVVAGVVMIRGRLA